MRNLHAHIAPHHMTRIRRAKAGLVRACRSKADDIRVLEAAALHWMVEVEVAYIEHPDTAAAHLAMTAGKGILKRFSRDLVPLAHKYEARHDKAIVHRIVAAIEGRHSPHPAAISETAL